jgi:NAD(P)-dependent dehydrogenase (short-subunit alcohol dehydrogenase family)
MSSHPDHVAIITGASRGIGLGIAEHLHAQGHRVLTSSRSDIGDRGDRWIHVAADLGTSAGIAALLDHPLASQATLLVNNVGQIKAVGGIGAETEADVRATFETNVFGPVECCRRIAPQMAAAGGGTVINVSSIYGSINPAHPVMSYAASKAALSAITQSLATEFASQGVRVNAILPGNIDTDMTRGAGEEYVGEVIARTPIGRLGTTDDINVAVDFLTNATFVTGHLLVVDGGISLIGG